MAPSDLPSTPTTLIVHINGRCGQLDPKTAACEDGPW